MNIARRFLVTNSSQDLQTAPTCCNALDINTKFSRGDNYSLASGIYYRIYNNELDPDSPRNGLNSAATRLSGGLPNFIAGNYYDGCTLNLINQNIECRYV